MLSNGGWSRKTLAGMEVVIRESAFQVTLFSQPFGALLGSEWYFWGPETTIEVGQDPPLRRDNADWIVARTTVTKSSSELALATESMSELWMALVSCGAEAVRGHEKVPTFGQLKYPLVAT
jgi:hypothetical protein